MKRYIILPICGLLLVAISACNSTDLVKQKQLKNQEIASLEYALANAASDRERLDLADKILKLDHKNLNANTILDNYSQKPDFQLEIADKYYQLAENNLFDDFQYARASNFLWNQLPKPQLARLDLLTTKFLLNKIETDSFNKDFFETFFDKINGSVVRNIMLYKFDSCEKVLNAAEKILPEVQEDLRLRFELYAALYFDNMSKRTPVPKYFWQKNLSKIYWAKRNSYLDKVIANRKKYLTQENIELLIDVLADIDEFEIALDMADDYKNIEGIDENEKLMNRIKVIASSGDHHKAFQLLKVLHKEKYNPDFTLTSLIFEASKIGDYPSVLQYSQELYNQEQSASNALLLYEALYENDKFIEAEKILESLKNDKLKYATLQMFAELKKDKFTPQLQQELQQIIADDKLFSDEWQEPDTQAFVYQLLTYLSGCKNQELLLKSVEKLSTISDFHYNAILLNSIGYTLLENNLNLRDAATFITESYLITPNDINILDSLAWLKYNLGEYGEAKMYIDRIFSLPKYIFEGASAGVIYLHAGDIYRANKLDDQAFEFYEKAANCQEDIFFKYDDLKKRFAK